jgi:hypothetical protein
LRLEGAFIPRFWAIIMKRVRRSIGGEDKSEEHDHNDPESSCNPSRTRESHDVMPFMAISELQLERRNTPTSCAEQNEGVKE